eukprot:g9206.t1
MHCAEPPPRVRVRTGRGSPCGYRLRPRWIYFALFTFLATPGHFLPQFLADRGISSLQIGWLVGVFNLVSVAAVPVFTVAADRTHRHKLFSIFLAAGSALAFLLLAIPEAGSIPALYPLPMHTPLLEGFHHPPPSKPVVLAAGWSLRRVFTLYLVLRLLYSVLSAPLLPLVDTLGLLALVQGGPDSGRSHVAEQGDKTKWGQERLWGSIAMAVMHILQGALIDIYGTAILYYTCWLGTVGFVCILCAWHSPGDSESATVTYAMPAGPEGQIQLQQLGEEGEDAPSAVSDALSPSRLRALDPSLQANVSRAENSLNESTFQRLDASLQQEMDEEQSQEEQSAAEQDENGEEGSEVPPPPGLDPLALDDNQEEEVQELHSAGSLSQHLRGMLSLCRVSPAFFSACLMRGLSAGMSESLLFVFFSHNLHASSLLSGLSVLVMIISEAPMMRFGEPLIRLLGVRGLLAVSHISFIVSMLSYSILQRSYLLLAIEFIHGITHASYLVAAMEHVSNLAHPSSSLAASAQGLADVVRFGFGQGVGTILGGLLLQRYGAVDLYRITALINALFLAVFLFSTRRGLAVVLPPDLRVLVEPQGPHPPGHGQDIKQKQDAPATKPQRSKLARALSYRMWSPNPPVHPASESAL